MGKVRTRILGLEDVEKKQKKDQKARAEEKKYDKKSLKGVGTEARIDKELRQPPKDDTKTTLTDEEKSSEVPVVKTKSKKQAKARVRGKKYQKALRLRSDSINSRQAGQVKKLFTIEEAIELLKKMKYAAFDESMELHLNLIKEGVKGEVSLPHEIGKSIRVKIVDDKLLEDIASGKIEFEVLISHPSYMPRLARHAKVLGPRGLMPSPKTGTVTDKPETVAKKFTGGFLAWRAEAKAPLLHQLIGKISYPEKNLAANIKSLVQSVGKQNISAAFVKTSMSPSVALNIESI